jgi:hypothetical protein
VSGYLESNEADDLVKSWQLLQRYHSQSTWAIKSSII